MARDKGLVVFSAMPGGGLTTMIDASIDETDRLMRDFFAIEEVNHREHEIQNVTVHTYDAAKGETPATLIPRLVRLYPNVYICRDLVDAESGDAADERDPRRPAGHHQHAGPRRRRGAAAAAADEAAAAAVRLGGDGRALPAADPQAVPRLQGGLHAAARRAEEAGHSAGQGAAVLPPAEAGGNREAVPDVPAASATSAARASSSCWW